MASGIEYCRRWYFKNNGDEYAIEEYDKGLFRFTRLADHADGTELDGLERHDLLGFYAALKLLLETEGWMEDDA